MKKIHGAPFSHDSRKRTFRAIIPAFVAYAAIVFAGSFFHAMWRDELHPWAMAAAATDLAGLFRLKAVEGHPDLWYILVYAVRQFTANPAWLQMLHAGIAACTAWLTLRYAPFPPVQRILLVFGYFYIFEYAMITRNYAPGILLTTLFLVLYPARNRHFLLLTAILALLAQFSVFGLILSGALFITLSSEWILQFPGNEKPVNASLKVAGTLLYTVAAAWSVSRVIPSPEAYFAGSASFSFSQMTLRETLRSLAIVWYAWVPLPMPGPGFWGTNLVGQPNVAAGLSLLLIMAAGAWFSGNLRVQILFFTGMAGIIGFVLMFYYGYLRHHGHLFILLAACMWLSEALPENSSKPGRSGFAKLTAFLRRHRGVAFTVILLVQLIAGLYAVAEQTRIPFSASRETARYISKNRLDRFLIAGDQDIALEPVAACLGRNVFFFSRNAMSGYLVYDTTRKIPAKERVIRMADSLVNSRGDTILLVMNGPVQAKPMNHLRALAAFTRSGRPDEKYYLYTLSPSHRIRHAANPEP